MPPARRRARGGRPNVSRRRSRADARECECEREREREIEIENGRRGGRVRGSARIAPPNPLPAACALSALSFSASAFCFALNARSSSSSSTCFPFAFLSGLALPPSLPGMARAVKRATRAWSARVLCVGDAATLERSRFDRRIRVCVISSLRDVFWRETRREIFVGGRAS